MSPVLTKAHLSVAAYQTAPLDEMPISVTNLRPSALTKIEDFLLQGKRREAYQYAMDEKLWAHAMVIASSIDKESWQEVVNDFLKAELGAKDSQTHGFPLASPHASKHSWETLRVAYSLFSGQGATAGKCCACNPVDRSSLIIIFSARIITTTKLATESQHRSTSAPNASCTPSCDTTDTKFPCRRTTSTHCTREPH